ncbi:uncharacterized protein LOC109111842 isoform X2 [Tachysurus ichikawai]
MGSPKTLYPIRGGPIQITGTRNWKITHFLCVLGNQLPLFSWFEKPSSMPALDNWFKRSIGEWESIRVWAI